MIQRLIKFYRNNSQQQLDIMTPLWRHITTVNQLPLFEALNSGTEADVSHHLSNIAKGGYLYGVNDHHPLEDQSTIERISRLGAIFGLVPVLNPEQPDEVDRTVSIPMLESFLGFTIGTGEVPGVFESVGIYHRMLFYASALVSFRNFLGKIPARVLEIGGGFGALPILLSRCPEAKSYTVIDLPVMAVMSAHVIGSLLGADKVKLAGEDGCAFANYYTSFAYAGVRESAYDLIVNTDSLPEMTATAQDEYLSLIADTLAPGGIFLSINHESSNGGQSSVLSAVRRNGSLRLVSRHAFEMRTGYVEEIFTKA